MHKKLASDLTSLAHSILQMKNKEDVLLLKEKAYEVYEKLSVLAYVEEYINTTPNSEFSREELMEQVAKAAEIKEQGFQSNPKTDHITPPVTSAKSKENIAQEDTNPVINISSKEEEESATSKTAEDNLPSQKQELPKVKEITEQPFDELQSLLFEEQEHEKNDVRDVGHRKTKTLEDELQDTIPVDVMANLFEKAEPKKSLNDHLQNTIQIGLNDRIAFVKHLFEGNQSDFNRVISQLNTFKTEKEAKKFITKLIKPDYDWSDKEAYELRLMEIIERRFA